MFKRSVNFSFYAKNLFIALLMLFATQFLMATNHTGTILVDETWYALDNPHSIQDSVVVAAGVTLTIEAGCDVSPEFGSFIRVDGTLDAIGDSASNHRISFWDWDEYAIPIRWKGIQFTSGSSGHFEYCSIRYVKALSDSSAVGVYADGATSLTFEHCNIWSNNNAIFARDMTDFSISQSCDFEYNDGYAVHLINCLNSSISNSTFTDNGGKALHLENCGEFYLSSVTSHNNESTLTIRGSSYPSASSAANFTVAGNTNSEGIYWETSVIDTLVKLYDMGGYAPYIATGTHTITSNGSFTIEENVHILFDNNSGITNESGYFHVFGSAGKEVLLSRRNSSSEWSGLRLISPSDTTPPINYCTIEYTESSNGTAIYTENETPQCNHCNIRNNNIGIEIHNSDMNLYGDNVFTNNNQAISFYSCDNVTFANQTFTSNGNALQFYDCKNFNFASGFTFTDNQWGISMDLASSIDSLSIPDIDISNDLNSDGIQLFGNTVASSGGWYDIGIPFIVTTDITLTSGSDLSLGKGVSLLFDNNTSLTVNGNLTVTGTPADSVVFTRRNITDKWKGIKFESGASDPVISYCKIEYAQAIDAIGLYGDAVMPNCSHCTFQHNTTGVKVINKNNTSFGDDNNFNDNTEALTFSSCDDITFGGNTFTNNTDAIKLFACTNFNFNNTPTFSNNNWGISMDLASSIDPLSQNIDISNDINSAGIHILDNTLSQNNTWNYHGLPYILYDDITLSSGISFSLGEGINFLLGYNAQLIIDGTFTINGTSANPVVFTHIDSSTSWSGINYTSSSSGNINHLTLEYANSAIQIHNSSVTFSNIISQYNVKGIYLEGLSNYNLTTTNHFQHNSNGIWAKDCENLDIKNQNVTDNTDNKGGIVLENCNNFTINTGNVITGNNWAVAMDFASAPSSSSSGNIPSAGNTNNDGLYIFAGSHLNDTTWPNIVSSYIVGESVTIPTGTALTIEPGCEILFNSSTGMTISGNLSAEGTLTDSIKFSDWKNDNNWNGLQFQNGQGNIEYCRIENAGSFSGIDAENTNTSNIRHCLLMNNDYGFKMGTSMPTLENCIMKNNRIGGKITSMTGGTISNSNTFINNTEIGLELVGANNVVMGDQTFTNNNNALLMKNSENFKFSLGSVFTDNTWPISIDLSSSIDSLSMGNVDLSNNVNSDVIKIFSETTTSSDVSWNYSEFPYIVLSDIVLLVNQTLTLGKDIHFLFDNNTGFTVDGTLNTTGTSADPVLFTRHTTSDNWNGIILSSDSSTNLDHLTLEYAANQTNSGIQIYSANDNFSNVISQHNSKGLYIKDTDNLSLTGANTFQNNTNGIYAVNSDTLNIQDQSVLNNTGTYGGIVLDDCDNFTINTGNTITGNNWAVAMNFFSYPNAGTNGNIPSSGNTHNDGLYVFWAIPYNAYVHKSATWSKIGVPYIIPQSFTIVNHVTLTIGAGAELLFDGWVSMHLDPIDTGLIAQGTATDSIIFSRWHSNEHWNGIGFSGGTGNFKHCKIEYAGNGSKGIDFSGTSLTVENSLFEHCSYGIMLHNNAFTLDNNRFINNYEYGIEFYACNNVTMSGTNYFSGNANGIYFYSCQNLNVSNITSINNTQSGIKFENCSSGITVDNCTLTGNDGYGAIMALASEEITLGSGNTISGNNWPITINPGTFITQSSVIPTTGNTHNDIQSTYGDCRKTGTWYKFSGLDYVITAESTIKVGGSLTLEAGNTLRFANGKGLTIWSSSSLNAVGTVNDSIYFVKEPSGSNFYFIQNTGTVNLEYCVFKDNPYYPIYVSENGLLSLKHSKITNCYDGIYFLTSNASSVIENSIIDVTNTGIFVTNTLHLGTGNIIKNSNYGIYLSQCSSPQFGASTIQNCNLAGIYFYKVSNIGTIDNLTLTGNNGYGALAFHDVGDFTLGANNIISENSYPFSVNSSSFPDSTSQIPTNGNTNNVINLFKNDCNGLTHSGTFHRFNIPYQITENWAVGGGRTVTFAAGDSIYVNEDKEINVCGILNVAGTASEPVTFTKIESSNWRGIHLPYNSSTANISYAIIEYADKGIQLYSGSANNFHIDHSIIQNNYYGIHLWYGNADIQSQNKIINNSYGIYLTESSHCSFGSSASEWNCIYGNSNYDICNYSPNDITAQYIYWGTDDSAIIAQHIYDQNDNSGKGLVTFEPYLTTEPGGGPAAPTNMQISISSGQVTISWDAVSGATSYKVYSSNDATSGFAEDNSGTLTGTTWLVGVSGSKKFYYVKAVN